MFEKRRKGKKAKEGEEENLNEILKEKERVKQKGKDVVLSDLVSRRQILDVLEW